MKIQIIKSILDEMEVTVRRIPDVELAGEIEGQIRRIRENLPKNRGGWKNPASAANGRKGGRPKKS